MTNNLATVAGANRKPNLMANISHKLFTPNCRVRVLSGVLSRQYYCKSRSKILKSLQGLKLEIGLAFASLPDMGHILHALVQVELC